MIAAEPHERWLFRKLTLTIRGGCNVTVASPLEQDLTTENTLLATVVSTKFTLAVPAPARYRDD